MTARDFDAAYYRRFYLDPRTRVAGPEDYLRLVRFLTSYLAFLGLPCRSVLDLGCGIGGWKEALAEVAPDCRYLGVETSPYLCERYGWEKGSLPTYRPEEAHDLVVCQGVLQYLDDDEAAASLGALREFAEGALYLEVLTRRDWEEACDQDRTDGRVHLRNGEWYRDRLRGAFLDCGGGLFVSTRTGLELFELEARP